MNDPRLCGSRLNSRKYSPINGVGVFHGHFNRSSYRVCYRGGLDKKSSVIWSPSLGPPKTRQERVYVPHWGRPTVLLVLDQYLSSLTPTQNSSVETP